MADALGLLLAFGAFAAFFAIGWWFLDYSLYRNLEGDRDISVQVCSYVQEKKVVGGICICLGGLVACAVGQVC